MFASARILFFLGKTRKKSSKFAVYVGFFVGGTHMNSTSLCLQNPQVVNPLQETFS